MAKEIFTLDARTATGHFPGIGRYVSSLAAELVPRLRPDELLAILTDAGARSNWALPEPGAGVRRLPVPNSPFSLSQQWRLAPMIRGSRVYHSPYFLMPYLAPAPTVLTVYDLIPLFFQEAVSPRTRLVFRIGMGLALRKARQVIAISESTRRDFSRHFGIDPAAIRTIPLAAAPAFQPVPRERVRQVREAFGLSKDFLLYVGSNKPHKNLSALVQACAALPADLPLVIAGAWDPRYPQARIAAETLGLAERVRFLGPLSDEDLAGLYTSCRLFVFPSLYEGFGLPLVEAMACGAPVASSEAGSLPEAGGQAAEYFDPRDPAAIAGTIRELLDSPARLQEMSTASLAQAGCFSWGRTADATIEIYRSITYN